MRKLGWCVGLLALGCGTGDAWSNYHETPVIERGACATVIMPGEQVPLGSQPSCPGGYSSIGGGVVVDQKDYERKTSPRQGAKQAIAGPAAVVGAPIAAGAAAGKAMRRNGQESGSSTASGAGPEEAPDPALESEDARIERMRREIIQKEARGRGQAPPPAPPVAGAAPVSTVASMPRGTIADELARLRAGRSATPPTEAPALAPTLPPATAAAPEPAAPVADRVEDRDGDGSPDHWVYRDDNGRPVRELFDENGDARADRTVWLDPVSGRPVRLEEDSNLDGKLDTWVEYENAEMARQRRDLNYDGQPDQWSYYADGKLVRQETDLDGDGFRNRESLYRAGHLAKEREDRNGDGRFDLVTLYDAEERVARRDEDRDGDGRIDSRSIFENGKLVRREVVSDPLDDGDDLSATEWSDPGGG
jgi:hypothetical protein